jgi:hypothetical protein
MSILMLAIYPVALGLLGWLGVGVGSLVVIGGALVGVTIYVQSRSAW